MKMHWVTTVAVVVAVGLGMYVVGGTLQAQNMGFSPTGKAAGVDVVRVFNEYQRQKDLNEEMKQLQDALEAEEKQRRAAIEDAQAVVDAMDRSDSSYAERMREVLRLQVEYKNWAEMKQADMTREVALWSIRIYDEIIKACQDMAEKEGYDFVIYLDEFTPVSMEPEVIKEQIRSRKVLYVNPAVDLTKEVTAKLNADYRAQPKQQMLYVP